MNKFESIYILVGIIIRKGRLTRRQQAILEYAKRGLAKRKLLAILSQFCRLEAAKRTMTNEWPAVNPKKEIFRNRAVRKKLSRAVGNV